jgi:hypothetical protein
MCIAVTLARPLCCSLPNGQTLTLPAGTPGVIVRRTGCQLTVRLSPARAPLAPAHSHNPVKTLTLALAPDQVQHVVSPLRRKRVVYRRTRR